MENYIPISFLNDFIFCPRSIYNHQLYANFDKMMYQDKVQLEGLSAHEAIDKKRYSDKTTILQNFEVYSDEFGLFGKLDVFDVEKKTLTERKNRVKTIYDGYYLQLYAQYFGLREMGFQVEHLIIYEFTKNKSYPIELPENNLRMFEKFKQTILEIRNYSLLGSSFLPNKAKCDKCIYNLLCDLSLC